MQMTPVKDLLPRGSWWNFVMRISHILWNIDQSQNVYEFGFIVVDQQVPPKHSDTYFCCDFLHTKCMPLALPTSLIICQRLLYFFLQLSQITSTFDVSHILLLAIQMCNSAIISLQ
jgi:hypothetical protein